MPQNMSERRLRTGTARLRMAGIGSLSALCGVRTENRKAPFPLL
jgi:hypothetical protein